MSQPFKDRFITLAHGAGGRSMQELLEQLIVHTLGDSKAMQEDQARLNLAELTQLGDRLAMTTDGYVVDPLFFPGADIGKLAVNGTVNDLAVGGAKPLYLSCGLVIEEGLSVETLSRVLYSMRDAADLAGVRIVTGDTKVVNRGAVDKLFINTTGVGVIPANVQISAAGAQPGDKILINGFLGDHGAAIVDARGELALQSTVESDCQPLNGLVETMLRACPEIHCMRDLTRGGLASVLNELAVASGVRIQIDESAVPVRAQVSGICEILGLDPLYLANEGKLAAILPAEAADRMLSVMKAHPAGTHSAIIGEVTTGTARVELKTRFGASRILDLKVGEQLPRIC